MQTGEVRIQIRIQRVKKGRVIMTEQNQKKTTEWQREEQHLRECRALIAANIKEYEHQFKKRHKETKALFDEVQSGNVELYDQMITSRNLEEHSYNQDRKSVV